MKTGRFATEQLAAIMTLAAMAEDKNRTPSGDYIFSMSESPAVDQYWPKNGKDRRGQYQRSKKDSEKLRKKKARKKQNERLHRAERRRT